MIVKNPFSIIVESDRIITQKELFRKNITCIMSAEQRL
jgi:hypothetical protein